MTTYAHKYFILNIFFCGFHFCSVKRSKSTLNYNTHYKYHEWENNSFIFLLVTQFTRNKFLSLLWACCRCVISNWLKYFWVSWQRICYTYPVEKIVCQMNGGGQGGMTNVSKKRSSYHVLFTIYASCQHCMWMQSSVGSLHLGFRLANFLSSVEILCITFKHLNQSDILYDWWIQSNRTRDAKRTRQIIMLCQS